MLVVVLTVVAIWLVLSVVASAACALVARGGLDEDRIRRQLADDLGGRSGAPRPRVPIG